MVEVQVGLAELEVGVVRGGSGAVDRRGERPAVVGEGAAVDLGQCVADGVLLALRNAAKIYQDGKLKAE